MGRHSEAAARWHFIRSVIVWAGPWVAGAALLAVVGWLALSSLPSDDAGSSAQVSDAAPPGGTPKGEQGRMPPSPRSTTPSPRRTPAASPRPAALITRGVTVQILDTTGGKVSASRWAHRLTKLGFDVVSVQPGLGPYPETTVYWSAPASRPAAHALAARFGWETVRRPASLSPEVAVHVVLGDDEA